MGEVTDFSRGVLSGSQRSQQDGLIWTFMAMLTMFNITLILIQL